MGKLDHAVRNRQQIEDIKRRYLLGEITRETARAEAKPLIDDINTTIERMTRELNKKYGLKRKPALLDFVSLMR